MARSCSRRLFGACLGRELKLANGAVEQQAIGRVAAVSLAVGERDACQQKFDLRAREGKVLKCL